MKVKNLKRTCSGYPSQWEFVTDGGRNAYVRYRWGYLSVRVSVEAGGEAVWLGIEILGRQLDPDGVDGVLDWSEVLKLIKPIHVENTLKSLCQNEEEAP